MRRLKHYFNPRISIIEITQTDVLTASKEKDSVSETDFFDIAKKDIWS